MIVIHCTATRADRPLSPAELTKMHRKRGFKCCGYHYFVRTDGEICTMRPVERAGAHAKGYNEHSIGYAYGTAEAFAPDSGEGAEIGFPGHHAGGGASRPEPGSGRRRNGGTGGMDQGLPLF